MDALETPSDAAFYFDLTLGMHGDEIHANKALAALLDEAERLGFVLIWRQSI
jgi:hypothetical protein